MDSKSNTSPRKKSPFSCRIFQQSIKDISKNRANKEHDQRASSCLGNKNTTGVKGNDTKSPHNQKSSDSSLQKEVSCSQLSGSNLSRQTSEKHIHLHHIERQDTAQSFPSISLQELKATSSSLSQDIVEKVTSTSKENSSNIMVDVCENVVSSVSLKELKTDIVTVNCSIISKEDWRHTPNVATLVKQEDHHSSKDVKWDSCTLNEKCGDAITSGDNMSNTGGLQDDCSIQSHHVAPQKKGTYKSSRNCHKTTQHLEKSESSNKITPGNAYLQTISEIQPSNKTRQKLLRETSLCLGKSKITPLNRQDSKPSPIDILHTQERPGRKMTEGICKKELPQRNYSGVEHHQRSSRNSQHSGKKKKKPKKRKDINRSRCISLQGEDWEADLVSVEVALPTHDDDQKHHQTVKTENPDLNVDCSHEIEILDPHESCSSFLVNTSSLNTECENFSKNTEAGRDASIERIGDGKHQDPPDENHVCSMGMLSDTTDDKFSDLGQFVTKSRSPVQSQQERYNFQNCEKQQQKTRTRKSPSVQENTNSRSASRDQYIKKSLLSASTNIPSKCIKQSHNKTEKSHRSKSQMRPHFKPTENSKTEIQPKEQCVEIITKGHEEIPKSVEEDDWNKDHYEGARLNVDPVIREQSDKIDTQLWISTNNSEGLNSSQLGQDECYDAESEDEEEEEEQQVEVGMEDEKDTCIQHAAPLIKAECNAVIHNDNAPFLIPTGSGSSLYGRPDQRSCLGDDTTREHGMSTREPCFPSPPSYDITNMAQKSCVQPRPLKSRILKCGQIFSHGPLLRPTIEPSNPPPRPLGRCNPSQIHQPRINSTQERKASYPDLIAWSETQCRDASHDQRWQLVPDKEVTLRPASMSPPPPPPSNNPPPSPPRSPTLHAHYAGQNISSPVPSIETDSLEDGELDESFSDGSHKLVERTVLTGGSSSCYNSDDRDFIKNQQLTEKRIQEKTPEPGSSRAVIQTLKSYKAPTPPKNTPDSYSGPLPRNMRIGYEDDRRTISHRKDLSMHFQGPLHTFHSGCSWAEMDAELRNNSEIAKRISQDINNNEFNRQVLDRHDNQIATTSSSEDDNTDFGIPNLRSSVQESRQHAEERVCTSKLDQRKELRERAIQRIANDYNDCIPSSSGSMHSDDPSSWDKESDTRIAVSNGRNKSDETPKKSGHVSFTIQPKPQRLLTPCQWTFGGRGKKLLNSSDEITDSRREKEISPGQKRIAALRSRNLNQPGFGLKQKDAKTYTGVSAIERPDVAVLKDSITFPGRSREVKRTKEDDSSSSSPEVEKNLWEDGIPGNWDNVPSKCQSKKKTKHEPLQGVEWSFKNVSTFKKSSSFSSLDTLRLFTPTSAEQSPVLKSHWNGSSPTSYLDKPEIKDEWQERFLQRYSTCSVLYVDTHCHIDFIFDRSGFKGSYQKYRRLNAATYPQNYGGCVAVFCNPRTFNPDGGLWKDILYEDKVWAAVGCHPKSATDFTERAFKAMTAMIKHPKVKAVGEIGLDYSGTFQKHEAVQKEAFRRQLTLAIKVNKPIVIHCRDAEQDCIEIMEELVPRTHIIHRHCFTGSWSEARVWLEKFPNSYIGLTPLITWKTDRSYGMRDVARNIPLNRLVLETDAPYFIPRRVPRDQMPFSHPGMAITVADEVAYIRNLSIDDVLRQCLANSIHLYGLDITDT